MNNMNRKFGLIFGLCMLIIFVLVFTFWLGSRTKSISNIPVVISSQEYESEIVWSHGDFSNETAVEYIETETKYNITKIPEMILFRHVTSGEWAKEFKPSIFLEIVNTDLSECFIDGRLRLDLNGKIYWIRLEED